MFEKHKKTSISLVVVLAIVLIAAVMVTGCKKQPAEPTQSEPLAKNTGESEKPDTEITTTSKMSLNDVIKAARTWGPAYKSWYGKMAPDFTLIDIAGKQHRLSDYRGKDVILIFWATWCPPCRVEIPHLIELRKTVGEDKLVILAISNEKPDLVKGFVAKQKINYTVLLDKGNMPEPFGVTRIYRTTGIPGSFFINPEGKIKLATAGMLSLDSMKAVLQAE
ncbi:MAG: peroxiredoxin family protein [Planctomycetota bacterium]|jgi:peroxiredoxin